MNDEIIKNSKNQMFSLIEKLFPICRSITGNGVRESLKIIKEVIPIEIIEIPSGTKVFDWEIPKEWNIKDGFIKNSKNEKIVDFKKSNLHILNYSVPINKKVSFNELKQHLFTLPDLPNAIPYLTSYYNENWGFCISFNDFLKLDKDEEYDVFIDSTLEKGFLTYGELLLKGRVEDEILITCYTCHPSLCNDNLSGVVLVTLLAKILKETKLNYSIRFLFIPETIGAITWLNQNEKNLSKIKYGLVATCVGDSGNITYKKTKKGNSSLDIIVERTLKKIGDTYKIIDFFPSGSDERQFCSPGINLNVGSVMRTPYGEFDEYHTSLDNLKFIKKESLTDSLKKYISIILEIDKTIENIDINQNKIFLNKNLKCEPQLGKRGIYESIGGQKNESLNDLALLWIMNQSDGENSLLDISIKSKIPFDIISSNAEILEKFGLIEIK